MLNTFDLCATTRRRLTSTICACVVVVGAADWVRPTANAAEPAQLAADCVYRDVGLTTLIEDLGEAKTTSGEALNQAFWAIVDARKICASGHVGEALARYDAVRTSLASTSAQGR
jgi:hypothetical protein